MGNDNHAASVYQYLLEGLSTGVLLFNNQLKLEYINPAGEILLEASARRLNGMNINELLATDTDLPMMAQKSLSTNVPFTEREVNLTTRHLSTVTVDCIMTPVAQLANDLKLLVEVKQIDRSLRISLEENQLNQNNAIRALILGMAHEIKNPLGGLRGAAQLLERELDSDELKEYTGIIIGEADRLRNLVNRLLGPNTLPEKNMINIHEITEHVRQLVEVEANHKMNVKTDYDPSIPEIYADKDQLIQALLNIMVNATQAIDVNGSIRVRTRTVRQFTIGSKCHKLVCQIDITDNGEGIPADIIKNIFFPMVTTRAEGSGLGLSISQSLIQQNGGLIQCVSEPGNTMFRILMPILGRGIE